MLVEIFGTNSSQYNQAIAKLTRQFGDPKFIVSAFIKQLEDFEQYNMRNPNTFVKYSAFLQKMFITFRQINMTQILRRATSEKQLGKNFLLAFS